MFIVGLNGYATSGKDTAAHFFVERYRFEHRAFADKLRQVLYDMNPIVYPAVNSSLGLVGVRLVEVVDRYGWDGAKQLPEVRELLQRLGNSVRERLGKSVWIDACLRVASDYLVISDVRFPNEARAIKQLGGDMVRINRPGVGPANDHISEIALDHWPFDAVVSNDRTPDDLGRQIAAAVGLKVLAV